MKKMLGINSRVDHVAIAVKDIEAALFIYQDIFGFELIERREISGAFSGMKSAELDAGGFKVVLVQGTEPESQVTRYIEQYGPGVQHLAIIVEDIHSVVNYLEKSGAVFATDLIRGDGLTQIFTARDVNSGMMFEFIERKSTDGFQQNNIQQLFNQLEANDAY